MKKVRIIKLGLHSFIGLKKVPILKYYENLVSTKYRYLNIPKIRILIIIIIKEQIGSGRMLCESSYIPCNIMIMIIIIIIHQSLVARACFVRPKLSAVLPVVKTRRAIKTKPVRRRSACNAILNDRCPPE